MSVSSSSSSSPASHRHACCFYYLYECPLLLPLLVDPGDLGFVRQVVAHAALVGGPKCTRDGRIHHTGIRHCTMHLARRIRAVIRSIHG